MRALRIDDRWLDRLGLAFLAATFALIAAFSVLRPAYNWDMLPYAALASETREMTAAERHDTAYRLVEAAVPASDWALLTGDGAYRAELAADAQAFDNQLGMYRIKPAYIHAARALARLMPVIDAFRALNLAALALLFAVAAWWMARGGFGRMAFVVAPVLVLADLVDAVRIVTPDLMCAALALAGLALLRHDRWRAAAACFAFATATRPDFAVFPAALLAASLVLRIERRAAVACFAASIAVYLLATLTAEHPGWWAHFSASLIGRTGDLSSALPFTFEAYARAVAGALLFNATGNNWLALAVLLGGGWLVLRDRPEHRLGQPDVLVLALLASLAARCAVFPELSDRIYLPTIAMLALLVAERWGAKTRAAGAA
jgi:hypothetical protein